MIVCNGRPSLQIGPRSISFRREIHATTNGVPVFRRFLTLHLKYLICIHFICHHLHNMKTRWLKLKKKLKETLIKLDFRKSDWIVTWWSTTAGVFILKKSRDNGGSRCAKTFQLRVAVKGVRPKRKSPVSPNRLGHGGFNLNVSTKTDHHKNLQQ